MRCQTMTNFLLADECGTAQRAESAMVTELLSLAAEKREISVVPLRTNK